jgi:putative nucleotidyltransferase with HDIG domain
MIPDVKECLKLMELHHMLANIIAHSIMVARVAEIITDSLNSTGHELSLNKIIAGALLHDIGKTACLDNDDDHAAKGVQICLEHGLESITDIIGEHVILRSYSTGNNFAEKEIVYYADKRVNHDRVVSLQERLAYILERYGKNDITRCQAIKKNYTLCEDLEERMFASLPFTPSDILQLIGSYKSKIDTAIHERAIKTTVQQ